jgi:predicted TIM-barrel fold metal-dependent hydrolase
MAIARIVDPHIHLWDLRRLPYPWLTPPFDADNVNGDVSPIARDYGLDDYLADAAPWPVEKVVHIEAGAAPEYALAETVWLQEMADTRQLPQGLVVFVALHETGAEARLATQRGRRNVRGVRHILNWHPDPRKTYSPRDRLEDPAWATGYALLAKYGLSFDLQIYPGQMAAAAALAARHPDVPVILNHAGMPIDRDAAGLRLWREGLARLAEQPHVSVKISGFGLVDRNWTAETIREPVLQVIEAFGTDRCMFASDFPTDRLHGPFGRHYGAYDAITSGFSEAERAALFAGNAERIYRL